MVIPAYLIDSELYRAAGNWLWPEDSQTTKTQTTWDSCRLERPPGPEFESGQIVVDKKRCWKALRLALWFNENSDFYYQHLHGDKETYHVAFRKLKKTYSLVPQPIHTLDGTMCQHDFQG